jgi:hypothetical protein
MFDFIPPTIRLQGFPLEICFPHIETNRNRINQGHNFNRVPDPQVIELGSAKFQRSESNLPDDGLSTKST